jgi:glycosyltransferase involved in cell wall biosynthesis
MLVTAALPGRIRGAFFLAIGALADVTLRRGGDHPVAAPVRALATEVARGRVVGVAQAEALGVGASGLTASRLARIALAAGDPAAADRILRDRPTQASDAASVILRGEIAYRLGYYADAVAGLEPIAQKRPSDEQVRRLLERSRAELALLDPAWRPDLGSIGRAVRPMEQPVKGRVLHLLTNSLPHRQAGYTVRAQSVALAQKAQGLDPQMVTRAGFPLNDGVPRGASLDVVQGIAYHRIAPSLEPGLAVDVIANRTARGLVPLIESLRPALLQPTTNYVNAQVALALGDLFKLPVVYEVRGFLEETWVSRMGGVAEGGDRYHAARQVETECMRRAAGIVTLSETMRTDILARGGIAPDVVTVVPNAVDIAGFTPGPRDEPLARTLGIEPDETVIGYISSFTAYEGIAYLIEAAALLRERGRRIRLLLVGDGEERANLEAVAERTGLAAAGAVVFTGRVPHREIARYYRTIDVFVVPRTNDRVSQLVTPLKPYEAMAMEKALVVSAVGALLEIVEEDVTALTFTPEDPVSLADAIEPLLDDPSERIRLGAAAREWVAANRTWEQNGRRYLALYQRLGVA